MATTRIQGTIDNVSGPYMEGKNKVMQIILTTATYEKDNKIVSRAETFIIRAINQRCELALNLSKGDYVDIIAWINPMFANGDINYNLNLKRLIENDGN